MPGRILLSVLAMVFVSRAAGDILINEALYDPSGPDEGFEFVELMAVGGKAGLEDLSLEFCNGGDPGAWTVLWRSESADSLAAGGLFLLGESEVRPEPDAVVSLGLQNGPDALRLSRDGRVLDLLGYGDGLAPDLCESWPAVDASSGRSLARFPDGVDTDQNVLDFFAADPTPGALNDPDYAAVILSARLPIPPPEPGSAWKLAVEVENRGRLDWPGSPFLEAGSSASVPVPALAAGRRELVAIDLPPMSSGIGELDLRLAGLSALPPDSLGLRFRVGSGPLLLSEVLFAPRSGRGEWVECMAPEGWLPTGTWSLEDLGGDEGRFLPPALGPGERFLLCGDRLSLLSEYPGLPAARVVEVSPWPSLANSGESESWPPWTDGLRLVGADGLDSDGILYRGDWIDRKGRSLERLQVYGEGNLSAWAPCPRGSSPLEGPDPRVHPTAKAWRVSPQPFDPVRGPVEFYGRILAGTARLRLFDAAGRPVQEITGTPRTGKLRLLWDGRDRRGRPLPSGAYPYALGWTDERGRGMELRGCCLLSRGGS